MTDTIAPFEERLAQALASKNLGVALGRSLSAFQQRRLAAFAGEDFAEIQRDLHRRKAAALARLPELVAQFTAEAEKVGAVVHRAGTAEEARRIIGDLAQRHDVKLAVKSKSMATEEIELNRALEALGVRVVETDLGEWIIQLAGERPSHLIAPAIHKTREEVAELFSRHTGMVQPPEVEKLVKVARRELRRAFVEADMGITGANIAIASTGTLVLVTNEGNGRLVSTLPRLHVALLGVEKIVPDLDDATAILKVLARNATGQKLSTYVSFTTGPSRTGDIELSLTTGVHGPEEVHIVLLDNGRTAAAADPAFVEALYCIRCGACSNVCPPYREVGGHAFGHIYTGPIGLVLTALHHGLAAAAGPQSLCLSCNACETVCPVGIPIPRQILDVRQQVIERKPPSAAKQLSVKALVEPGSLVGRLARLGQVPFTGKDGLIRSMPGASEMTRWRSLPAFARRSFAARDRHRTPQPTVLAGTAAEGLTVSYFPGCITDQIYPEMGVAVVGVLEGLGARVAVLDAPECCGLPYLNMGDGEAARSLARRLVETLEQSPGEYVVSGSNSCVVSITQDYAHLFADDPAWLERAERQAARVIDFTSFLTNVAQLPAGALADGPTEPVTYHDSCQSANCLKLQAEPRRILSDALGLEIVEMADSSVCCGFGGSFSIEHPQVAQRIMGRKLANAEATGARMVVADNPGCIMHLRGGIDAAGKPLVVKHLAEVVAERMVRRGAVPGPA
ncbi:MAG: LUD domain-containing protein [Chloroflexi bacterium]|nr:LUD domain-containing protein [Chloroflexota bacterium]